jgi:AraC-like DNA-binding protein
VPSSPVFAIAMIRPAFHPDALRGYRLFESCDLDETRERISRVMQPHALVPHGNGHGHSYMDFVKLGGLGLGTIAFGEEMRVDVEAMDGYYLLMFCIAGSARVRTMGQSLHVDRDAAVLCPPGERFDALLSPDCEQFVLRIDPAALRARLGASGQGLAPLLAVNHGALSAWMQQLQLIAGSSELLACAQSNPRVAVQLERLLLDLLTDGQAATLLRTVPQSVSPGFVRRAQELIDARYAEPLQLQDMSEAVGVPARTLREGFQQFKGLSPMQYLRQVRLQHARDSLLQGGGLDQGVTEIALDCGFVHLGRFAIAYKEQFGELPSETLRDR